MASNEYYYSDSRHPVYPSQEYSNHSEAPLPPAPQDTSYSLYRNDSYNNHTYPYLQRTTSGNYTNGSGQFPDEDLDPYDDRDSIPLNGRKPKYEPSTTVAPVLPHQEEDPFVRDVNPAEAVRPRAKGPRGWIAGLFKGKVPWVTYFMSLVQFAVFIAELVQNGLLTGSPIEIHPSFNPMIGPSSYVLINMGGRYQPCMHNMEGVQDSTTELFWPCPNATSTTGSSVSCSLSELCGMGGVPNPHVGGSIDETPAPNQWWRFIIPIFIHAGIVHIGFNLLLQLTLGRDVERLIGSTKYLLLYLASGIFGFILGGNFAGNGIVSTGCSGSLFGLIAITYLDLFYTWKQRPKPWRDLIFIIIDCVISLVLGLLPGLDNFSHIGGLLMGLVLGICILRSPTPIAQRATKYPNPQPYIYSSDPQQRAAQPFQMQPQPSLRENMLALRNFAKDPATFFRDRRPVWWAWTALRFAALVGILVGFILLLKNFYVWRDSCSWCKYLSCLDVTVDGSNWCDVGNLDFTTINSTSSKRALFGGAGAAPWEFVGRMEG